MARFTLIVFSLVLLLSTTSALISETMIGSAILLNTILGVSFFDMVLAGAIGQASSASSSLRSSMASDSVHAVEHFRRKRQYIEDEPIGWVEIIEPSTNPNEESQNAIQADILHNMQNIAHDVASGISLQLGLPAHTLEAFYLGERDAPNLEDVVDTVAKRFNAPPYLLAGLHTMFQSSDKYEDYYE